MAGIFESQVMPGSSLKGESFAYTPAVADISQQLETVGRAGVQAYQGSIVKKAQKEVEEHEAGFLESTAANRQDEADLDELRNIDPAQTAVYQDAVKQIKKYESAINQRGVNPAQALSKRDAIISKAASRAPLFAQELRNLTTNRTVEFESEADQLIKETNAVRDDIVELFGTPNAPDVPSMRQQYFEYKAAERNAKYITSRTTINSAEAAAKIGPVVDNYLKQSMAVIDQAMVNGIPDMTKISDEERRQAVTFLQQFKNGNELNIARNLLYSLGIDPKYINQDTIKNAGMMLSGRAEAYEKAMNGSIPKQMAEYDVEFAKSDVLLNLKASNPGTFAYVSLLPYIKDSIAGTGIVETGGNDIKKYLTFQGLGQMDMKGLTGMKQSGIQNPRQTQNLYSDALDKSLDSWKELDPQLLDRSTFDPFMSNVIKDINYMTTNPDEFTPKMFEPHIKKINDQVYMDWFNKLNPVQSKEYSDAVRNSVVSYARQKMAKDINKELGKELGSYEKRELVSPIINPTTGTIRFVPNTKGKNQRFAEMADTTASELNRLYGQHFDLIQLTGRNYGKLPSGEVEAHFMKLLFSDVFQEVGDPLRLKAEDYNETVRRENLRNLRRTGIALPDDATEEQMSAASLARREKERYDAEFSRLEKERNPFSSQYKTDIFDSAIQEAIAVTTKQKETQSAKSE